jgi:hypothetical protein
MISRIKETDGNRQSANLNRICVSQVIIREICDKKNHRRKIMLTMVTKFFYNRLLTAKSVLGSVAFLYRVLHSLFHFVLVIAVAHSAIRVSVPKESADKPNK